jgi:hypothetical protein
MQPSENTLLKGIENQGFEATFFGNHTEIGFPDILFSRPFFEDGHLSGW